MDRKTPINLYEGSELSFGLSFSSLIIILLAFFVFLDAQREHNPIRAANVLAALEKRIEPGAQLSAVVNSTTSMQASTIINTAQKAGFEVTGTGDQFRIVLPSAKLFPSGSDQIEADVIPAIERLADVTKYLSLYAVIEGHTDDRPISTARFRSNWDLSTARSVAVLRLFLARGVSANHIAASGRAEFQPLESNLTEVGRARNRRVVVTLTAHREGKSDVP